MTVFTKQEGNKFYVDKKVVGYLLDIKCDLSIIHKNTIRAKNKFIFDKLMMYGGKLYGENDLVLEHITDNSFWISKNKFIEIEDDSKYYDMIYKSYVIDNTVEYLGVKFYTENYTWLLNDYIDVDGIFDVKKIKDYEILNIDENKIYIEFKI